jgi:hypothetical protein
MKKLTIILIFFFSFSFYAQDVVVISKKASISKKGYCLKVKKVIDDSRCPEGVNCIWEGEVTVIIDVYKNKKLVEEKQLTLNTKNKEANSKWFSIYLPKKSKEIKEINLLPYPKKEQLINPKKQFVEIVY